MTREQYQRITEPFRGSSAARDLLILANNIATHAFYVLYPVLLYLINWDARTLAIYVGIPGVSFVAVRLARRIINKPRPYEAFELDPVIKKDTTGKSFPSCHVFSAFIIALCWMTISIPAGILLLCGALVLSVLRVTGGVHYPSDVIAGAVIGIIFGLLVVILA